MKTLAMMKMEKNFIAHNEKKYPRKPYEVYTTRKFLSKLEQEYKELAQAIKERNIKKAKLECADVSNIVDFIFERLSKGAIE